MLLKSGCPNVLVQDTEHQPVPQCLSVCVATYVSELGGSLGLTDSVYFRYFMALVQEMAVKIDQGFLEAILTVFTPAADPVADRQKVRLGSPLMLQLCSFGPSQDVPL